MRNPRLFSLDPDKRRTSPDPGSVRSISYEAQFTLAMIQMDASRKTADQPFLRDKSTISPKTVSDGEKTLPRIYKKILSCDTKLGSGTESQTRQSCGGKTANTLHYF